MVDINKVFGGGDGKKKTEGKGGASEVESPDDGDGDFSQSGSVDPFTLDEDAMMDPGDVDMVGHAEEMAGDAELNFDKGTGSINQYRQRQVKETRELHEDMKGLMKEYDETLPGFTIMLQTCIYTLAQNRVGIAGTIRDNFNKSTDESLKLTNQICKKAGEDKLIAWFVTIMTKKLMGE